MRKIINFESYDKQNKIKEVWNSRTFNRTDPSQGGLYDPIIFENEATSVAYIKIPTRIINPIILNEFGSIHSYFKQCVELTPKKPKYFVVREGQLEQSEQSIGGRGIGWLYNQWDNIDLKKYSTEKNRVFIKHLIDIGKNAIFINRIHVSPIVIRPYQIKNGIAVKDQLTEMYESILYMNNKQDKSSISAFIDTKGGVTNFYQDKVNEIYNHLFNLLDGKGGFYRNLLSGHRVDNNTTLVMSASSTIYPYSIVVSWHYLLVLYDTYLLGILLRPENVEKKKMLGLDTLTNAKEFGDHMLFIQKNVNEYCRLDNGERNKQIWIELLAQLNDEYNFTTMGWRNPTFSRNEFASYYNVIIETENQSSVTVSSLLLSKIGGDNDGDTYSLNTLTDENAKKSVFRFSAHDKNFWSNLANPDLATGSIADGAITGLFNGTDI